MNGKFWLDSRETRGPTAPELHPYLPRARIGSNALVDTKWILPRIPATETNLEIVQNQHPALRERYPGSSSSVVSTNRRPG